MSGGKGGSGSKVHEISVGAESVLGLGSFDKVTEIKVDNKTAWKGVHLGGRLWVSARNLFGGHDKEGGIEGWFDFRFGKANQTRSAYLVSVLGALIPARRGITTLVLEKIYIGLNPYMKKMSYKIQSVFEALAPDETQWYPAKAGIPLPDFGFDDTLEWSEGTSGGSSFGNDWRHEFTVDKTGWMRMVGDLCHATNGNYGSTYASKSFDISQVSQITFSVMLNHIASNYPVPAGVIYVGGNPLILFGDYKTFPNLTLKRQKAYTVSAKKRTSDWVLEIYENGSLLAQKNISMSGSVEIYTRTSRSTSMSVVPQCGSPFIDMLVSPIQLIKSGSLYAYNPAHAIREIHTSRKMMNIPENEIDDASFTAAADRLYTEGFGLSPFALNQRQLESLIDDICQTIGAKVYQDPNDGLYKIKLLRYDYDPDTLPVLDERHIGDIKNIKQQKLGEVVTHLTVKFNDHKDGKQATALAMNTPLKNMQSSRITDDVDYSFVVDRQLASRIAERDLRALAARPIGLELTNVSPPVPITPGAVLKLDLSSNKHNKHIKGIFRVEKIEEGNETDSSLTIKVIQDVFSLLPESYLTVVEVPTWERPDSKPVPAVSYAAEAPYYEIAQNLGDEKARALSDTDAYLYAVAERPNDQMISAKLATDRSGDFEAVDPFEFTATFKPSAAISITDTTIAAPINEPAMLQNLPVNSHLLITEGDQFEHVIFKSYNQSNNNLTVERGCLDTVPHSFTSAAKIWASDMFYGLDEVKYAVGQSVTAKVLTVSSLGALEHPFADPLSVSLIGRQAAPYPAANVKYNNQPFHIEHDLQQGAILSWTHRNRLLQTASLTNYYANSVTPETGLTYQIIAHAHSATADLGECLNINVGLVTQYAIDISAMNFNAQQAKTIIIRVHAVRNGIQSIQAVETSLKIKNGYGINYGVSYGS